MGRISSRAAGYWMERAREAQQADDVETAWKHLMHTLTIRPDYLVAAALVRKLESEHPQRLAGLRRRWLLGDAEVLVVADASLSSEVVGEPADLSDQQVAWTDESLSDLDAHLQLKSSSETPETPGTPETKTNLSARLQIEDESAPSESVGQPPRDPFRPSTSGHRPVPRLGVAHDRVAGYLVTYTVSREDKRFSKKVDTVDGILVELKDTDHGPNADLVIYRSRERIHRNEDWRVGESVTVVGRSGRRYRIRVVGILDSTETVRFNVRTIEE